jgi:predicted tellurium resistance membrane protein TerC
MDALLNPEILMSLLTLTVLEIVLGIDNVVFISILAGKLPSAQQPKARQWGLSLALITRLMLLAAIAWMAKLTAPLFAIPHFHHDVSGRDLILLGGGLFLIWKSVHEIHQKLEGEDGEKSAQTPANFASVLFQIVLLDIVFSLDSVITAIGMANDLWVMCTAVILAIGFMLKFAGAISDFVNNHPTIKMLALSFLLLIGVVLLAEGAHQHIPKGYIYFAMAFSVGVEMLNLKMKSKKAAKVELHQPYR